MNCLKCNAPLQDTDKFCPVCGEVAPQEEKVAAAKPAFCGNCGAQLGEDDVFCPDCGTPTDPAAIKLSQLSSANQQKVAAPPVTPAPKAQGNVLAPIAYILYAVSTLLLIAVILMTLLGINKTSHNITDATVLYSYTVSNIPNIIPGGNLSGTDSSVSSDSTVNATKPSTANHQPITEITPETAQQLADIYREYSYWGICPGGTKDLDYEEGKAFMRGLGWSEDDISAYSAYRMTECHTIDDMEKHARIYITDELATEVKRDSIHHKLLEKDGELYYFVGAMGWPGYYYLGGSLVQESDGVWSALFSTDYTDEVTRITFIWENGAYKVSDCAVDTAISYPYDHPVFVGMTEDTAKQLIDIYLQYDMFGICPGDFISVPSSANEEIFSDIGLDPTVAQYYTIYSSDDCRSISAIEEHIRFYLTDSFASSISTPNQLVPGNDFYVFEWDGDAFYATASVGIPALVYDEGSLINVGGKWKATATFFDQGDSYPAGTFTFVEENGLYKIESFESAN